MYAISHRHRTLEECRVVVDEVGGASESQIMERLVNREMRRDWEGSE